MIAKYEIKDGFEGRPIISYYDYMELHPYDRHKYERIIQSSSPCANHDRESQKEEEKLNYTLIPKGLNISPINREECYES